MPQSFLERIHRAGSSRSIRSQTNRSQTNDGAGDASSVATFEFANMNVLLDSQSQPRQRRMRKRPMSLPVSGDCIHSIAEPKLKLRGHEEERRLLDHDGEPLLLTRPSGDSLDHALDLSEHSISASYRGGSASETSGFSRILPSRTVALSFAIAIVGLISSTLFLGFGIGNAVDDQGRLFTSRANGLAFELEQAWHEYVMAALWIYQACTMVPLSRGNFTNIYRYAKSNVDIQAVEWIQMVLDEDRQALEDEAFAYYRANYPDTVHYQGIMGIAIGDRNDAIYLSNATLQPRPHQEYYYPIHFVEPISGPGDGDAYELNVPTIDVDLRTSDLHMEAIRYALDAYQPAATASYRRFTSENVLVGDRYFELFHPGIPSPEKPELKPHDLVALVIRLGALIETASEGLPESLSIFIYDSTESDDEPGFLVAAELYKEPLEDTGERIIYLDEVSLAELEEETVVYIHITKVRIASRTWTLAVVQLDDTYIPDIGHVLVGGKFIMIASFCTSLWILTNYRRTKTILEVKRLADQERTRVIVRTAREKAKSEQELNDYIAHEIRNPLAAAMSACTFVKSAINDENPLNTQGALKAIREDVEIIDSSLTFTHDLLRSMLDMHRAASHNLLVHESPLDVARDILEPVVSMLYQRNVGFDILTECPEGLFVVSDRLRLKQILLNLCRNSARYVQKGYIKIGANVVDGHIQFFVEDSGQGISREGRKHLFSRFQESLEVMDQGSGVGLCLCKSMALLLHGDIWLDESFDSGIEGYPGSRFVIGLNKGPTPDDEVKKILDNLGDQPGHVTLSTHEVSSSNDGNTSDFSKDTSTPIEEQMPLITKKSVTVDLPPMPNGNIPRPPPSKDLEQGDPTFDLPSELSVLFVDDDMILRKLFVRSVRKVMSTWDIQEAASGEAALRLIDTKEFDIIFMDQYMASVEKKLLGTETVHAMRSKGVRSRICGLSANDVEEVFLSNGADAFMFKPFPCKKEQLERELWHLLHISRHSQHAETTTPSPVTADVLTRRPEELDGSNEKSDHTENMVVDA